ncbi:MAG: HDOD domain-containing protein [Desulfuromonadales bacterium]|nr:HDOD domain-containing protein [Chloroflexota bacterium]MCK4622863.1 HDOD domain-containing protein [Desulfuromonadales bacterium]
MAMSQLDIEQQNSFDLKQDLRGVNLTGQEQRYLSNNHAKLGARMAEHWGFPQPLIEAIEGHHAAGEGAPLSVKIAALIKGHPESDDSRILVDKARQLFGLDATITAEMVDDILQESAELSAALN